MLATMNSNNRIGPAINRINNNKSLKPEEKQTKITALQTAYTKFLTDNRTTADKFIKQTDDESKNLGLSDFSQKCLKTLQDAQTAQTKPSTDLMAAPTTFCSEMTTAFTTFQSANDAARAKV